MEPAEVLLRVAGCGALFGAVIGYNVWDRRRERRAAAARAAGLRDYAAHREWDYVETDERLARLFVGAPFDKGTGRTATHVLRGRHRGRECLAYDHGYLTRSGRGSFTTAYQNYFSVMALRHDLALDGITATTFRVLLDDTRLDWRLDGDWVVVVREKLHTPPEIEATLDRLSAALDLMPR